MEFEENGQIISILDVTTCCRYFDGLYEQRQQ